MFSEISLETVISGIGNYTLCAHFTKEYYLRDLFYGPTLNDDTCMAQIDSNSVHINERRRISVGFYRDLLFVWPGYLR